MIPFLFFSFQKATSYQVNRKVSMRLHLMFNVFHPPIIVFKRNEKFPAKNMTVFSWLGHKAGLYYQSFCDHNAKALVNFTL